MSKLMSVLGIVLLAVGAALALVGFVNPAQMNVYGLTMDTAAIMLTGGILSVGLGGVIAALQGSPATAPEIAKESTDIKTAEEVAPPPPPPVVERPKMPDPVVEKPSQADIASRVRFNPFARKTETAAAAAGAAVVVAEAVAVTEKPATKSAVDDTIAALEQAKADIANAIGGVDKMATPPEDEPADDATDDADDDTDAVADGELYVMEEREIRGRPARILSDNTVEAETDEGWMRFENLEHLNEYLDSMGEPA
jgi:hypothetical protein